MFELPNEEGPVRRALDKVRSRLQKGLTHRENFDCAIVEWKFTHGVLTEIENPLRRGAHPFAFVPYEAWDENTKAPMSVVGTPKVSRAPRDDRKLAITVEYDLRHTAPRFRREGDGTQVIATGGADTPVSFATAVVGENDPTGVLSVTSNGAGPANTRITSSEAGRFAFSGAVQYPNNAVGSRYALAVANNNGSSVGGTQRARSSYMTQTDGNAVAVPFAGQVTLAAGGYFEIFCWQNSGGNLTLAAALTFIEVTRLANHSTPTGIVRGVLWGG